MAGVKDKAKRGRIRKLLRSRRWQTESDRAIAREVGCGKNLVTEVRRQLISEGRHPPLAALEVTGRRLPEYRVGGSVRGGVVYDHDGRPVRLEKFLLQSLPRGSDLAKELRRRLAEILGKK